MSTEIQNSGFFARLFGAVIGIGFGLLLLLAGPSLLFWNEGRAVKTAAAIAEGASAAVHIDPDTVDASKDGRLVHVNGEVYSEETLKDAPFGISVKAIALERHVEMFQWKQNSKSRAEKKLGGGKKTVKTYTYEEVWSGKLLKSERYKEPGHTNPTKMPFEDKKTVAATVTLGAFTLDDTLKGMIGGESALSVSQENLAASQWANTPGAATISDGEYFIGKNPADPKVGDVRVSFTVIDGGAVSVLAKQEGKVLGRYTTSNGYAVHNLAMGTTSMSAMFESQESGNSALAWVLRVVGFGLVFVGLMAVLGPLRVVADIVPFLGRIAGVMMGVVAFLGAVACTLPTIGVAWIFYRPLLGIALLVIGAFFVFLLLAAVALAFRLTREA